MEALCVASVPCDLREEERGRTGLPSLMRERGTPLCSSVYWGGAGRRGSEANSEHLCSSQPIAHLFSRLS
ncbi:hypothetical protein E2562_019873 [Oryza meyeriana var. granulata]|uniref:Uncharacterized protein n=1 Tax=Oryza meyeriana var. granulata TaxID=110450 RepID=A0A6G1EX90_9ORYZ|nr:hypothetical protein E2562_019873 [Oryza meyeriana var. granulata]